MFYITMVLWMYSTNEVQIGNQNLEVIIKPSKKEQTHNSEAAKIEAKIAFTKMERHESNTRR